MITNCRTGEVVFASQIPLAANERIIGLAEEHRVDILTYEETRIITNNDQCPYAVMESNINHLPLVQVESMKDYVRFEVAQIPHAGRRRLPGDRGTSGEAALGKNFSVYRSEPYFLEVMPKGIDKALSLARLLEVLGMTKDQMIACGDGYNDLTMVQFAGLGVAMENAVLPLRKAADYITLSNNEDGVAHVVEKYMLS